MSEIYSEGQTQAILDSIGISIEGETATHFLVLCPFHGNLNTPAMVVDKEEGVFYCNNGGCQAAGTMRTLIKRLTDKTEFQVEMLIHRAKNASVVDIGEYIERKLEPKEFPVMPEGMVEKMHQNFLESQRAQEYMYGRGFEERTMRKFQVGYAPKKGVVTVPMFSIDNVPVGFIGRAVYAKRFHNRKGLPRKETLFNIQNARKNETAVIVEASFDAMMIWQATGIHAVATLGSSLTDYHADQLNKYFTHIIIATDDDRDDLNYVPEGKRCRKCMTKGHDKCQGHDTGLELGMSIAEKCRGKRIEWAHADSLRRFGGAKDPGELSHKEIRYAIDNAISHFEMVRRVA